MYRWCLFMCFVYLRHPRFESRSHSGILGDSTAQSGSYVCCEEILPPGGGRCMMLLVDFMFFKTNTKQTLIRVN